MKFSEAWLREWVNPSLSTEELVHCFTMAGLEVDNVNSIDGAGKENNQVIDIDLTPNRGDCLSILGLAREMGALTNTKFNLPKIEKVKNTLSESFPIASEAVEACPRYLGLYIKGVDAKAATPDWICDRLNHCGVRTVSLLVDITNYVMLELGQPMHAFDASTIRKQIKIRYAQENEKLVLLDEQEVKLATSDLVIADAEKPLALAGVMGGLPSSVHEDTHDIFLESAFFNPIDIMHTARRLNISTDSSYRFERGVDPAITQTALERARQLIVDIAGGTCGPVCEYESKEHLPVAAVIRLRAARIAKLLGAAVPADKITTCLQALGCGLTSIAEGEWEVTAPTHRFDLRAEVDLVEEVARMVGYENLPTQLPSASLCCRAPPEGEITLETVQSTLVARGFQEVITYSFVDKDIQSLLFPNEKPIELLNPISSEMSQMRLSLWPGLIQAALYNQRRQQERLKLFEVGLRFIPGGTAAHANLTQEKMLSGLLMGSAWPKQWGYKTSPFDFFDLKNEVDALFDLTGDKLSFKINKTEHPSLHPGQSALIEREGRQVGFIGALHPQIQKTLDCPQSIWLFELQLGELTAASIPMFQSISKFPLVTRDLAFVIDENTTANKIIQCVEDAGGDLLEKVNIFDIYQGKGIEQGKKSIALSLSLRHQLRTLNDEEVNAIMTSIMHALTQQLNAIVRN